MTCPDCGFTCEPDFAFCPRCGGRLARNPDPTQPARRREASAALAPSPLVPPEEEADRRLVTVLFADVSGFTSLSERIDPEEIRRFQSDLVRELVSVVRHFDGFVEKFVGDAVMAAFGAPVAHEDDPERALGAALAMTERMQTLSQQWEGRFGRALTLHIGINTGPVVAGTLGSHGDAAYAVTGDTVNTAARLHGVAGPGEILISEATSRIAEHAFVLEPVGELTVKGKSVPLRAHRVIARRQSPASPRGLLAHGLSSPLVGGATNSTRWWPRSIVCAAVRRRSSVWPATPGSGNRGCSGSSWATSSAPAGCSP